MDLNKLKDKNDIYQLKDGIFLILDYNEERQFEISVNSKRVEKVRNYIHEDEDNSVQVHLDSIGIKLIFPSN